jgi:hypothetical protein
VDISNVSATVLKNVQENQREILSMVTRLCELIPPGASMLFNIDMAKGPQLVTAGGRPVGKVFELIQINRPIAYIQQECKVGRTPS